MIVVDALRDFLIENGAEIIHEGSVCSLMTATGFAHCEDATPGNVSWLRHDAYQDFGGTVLMLRDGASYTRAANKTQLLVAHRNIRALVSKTIRQLFVRTKKTCVAQTARVHPTVVMNAEAQNYEWIDDQWADFPATGGVRIEEDVVIGPYAMLVHGSVGDTVIAQGCRIGQHVNIGHDCRVGAHTLIIAHASLAGWVRVGKHCRIYQGACIKNGVCIGDGAVIGMGAVVSSDVGPGEIWVGNPARRVGRAA